MAEDITDGIATYLVALPAEFGALLAGIRHWDNLKAAADGTTLWVKNFTENQLNSVAVQSIAYKQIYYQKGNRLFLMGNLLPEKKISSALLWSPLARMLPVNLPPLNHNYFGTGQKLNIHITPAITEQPAIALRTDFENAAAHINKAAQIRITGLSWVGIGADVLLMGIPLLPVSGQTYWLADEMLFPTGYDFEYPQLRPYVREKISAGSSLILWEKDSTYILIPKNCIKPLSISSFRLTHSLP